MKLNWRTGVASGLIAGLVALGSMAGAQDVSPEWQKIIDAAKAEGKVTLYTSQGLKQVNDLAARFKEKYGIEMEIVRGLDSDFPPKLDVEVANNAGIADVVVQTNVLTQAEQEAKGYFVTPVGPAFNNPDYKKEENAPRGVSFITNAAVVTFSWNTDLWEQGVKDYSDIFHEDLKGQIGITAINSSSQADNYFYLMENYGEDFVERLAEMKPRVYPGAYPMAQALSAGEIAVALYTEPQIDEKAMGAPVDSGIAPLAWGARFHGNIMKSAPHPNAAQLLANFLVTPEGQEAIARKNASVLPGIEGSVIGIENVRKPDPAKVTPEKVQAFKEKFTALFSSN